MKLIVVLLGVTALCSGFSLKEHERFPRQAPATIARTASYPAGTQRTSDGVPILRETYRDSKVASRDLPTSDDHHTLTLYEDFVNDPYVSTEELGSLLRQKHGNRELRTGYQSPAASRDRVWSTRSGNNWRETTTTGRQQQLRATEDRQTRPVDPVNGEQGNAWWEVASRSGDHITYRRRGTASNTDSTTRRWSQTRQGGTERSGHYRANASQGTHATSHAANLKTGATSVSGGSPYQETRSAALRSESGSSQIEDIGDANWVVASRSDDHITYRRKDQLGNTFDTRSQAVYSQHQAPVHATNTVQRLGQGEGEVYARVVNTGASDEEGSSSAGRTAGNFRTSQEARRRDGSQLASYRSMRRNYAHSGPDDHSSRSHLQLKSGDYVSYRAEDGSEAVYPRLRSNDGYRRYQRPEHQQTIHPVTTPRSVPQEFEQEGNWRVVSKDDSHITWTRVGSEYERNPTTVRPYTHGRSSWTTEERSLRLQSPGSGPHYPMLLERETAERNSRLGANTGLRIAY